MFPEMFYFTKVFLEKEVLGSPLVVLWSGFGVFTAMAQVQSVAGELRSHRPHSTAKRSSVVE